MVRDIEARSFVSLLAHLLMTSLASWLSTTRKMVRIDDHIQDINLELMQSIPHV